jgi:hypothetical protein
VVRCRWRPVGGTLCGGRVGSVRNNLGGHYLLEIVDLVAVTLDHSGELLNLGGETLESVRQSLEPIISSQPVVSISTLA